jgi:hypothetical protein
VVLLCLAFGVQLAGCSAVKTIEIASDASLEACRGEEPSWSVRITLLSACQADIYNLPYSPLPLPMILIYSILQRDSSIFFLFSERYETAFKGWMDWVNPLYHIERASIDFIK